MHIKVNARICVQNIDAKPNEIRATLPRPCLHFAHRIYEISRE